MRVPKLVTAGLAVTGVVAAVTVAGSGAGAATENTVPHFLGTAGATYVNALGGAVKSGSTAVAGVDSLTPGTANSNQLADAGVGDLIDAGAADTKVTTAKTSTGANTITAHTRTTGVSLLNGLITAKAIDTTSTATMTNETPTVAISTTFVDLSISRVKLPVTIGKNLSVTIPGVAQVTLNYAQSSTPAGAVGARGAGLVVTLLTARGPAPAKSFMSLNPVSAAITMVGDGYRILGGRGIALQALAHVNSQVTAVVSGIGRTSVGNGGTGGEDVDNNIAGVAVSNVATIRSVGSTANGLASDSHSYATETVETAGVDLFGGVVTADALKGVAHSEVSGSAGPVTAVSTQLVNLKIAGRAIPANVAPNTAINLAGFGTVYVNVQFRKGALAAVTLLDVKLSTSKYGLPAGAEVQVGVASASTGT